ncbi:unnamed protein product [Thlaspi arvense]|uniref:F-box associated beta-propeller type 1 domain-containing protein n=1 Tax=Thlaspi arvense TaxID=13288 RepID=A0AAU9SJ95_THLAR|nr:unnamed protein product [Thlaspi arvense]
MDSLSRHLLDKVLFGIDLRSLAMMRCTNRSLNSHITHDPYFNSEYFSLIESGLFHISSTYRSNLLSYHPFRDSRSTRITKTGLKECHILGSCSGLLLLFIDDCLCVVNPITEKFRFLNNSRMMEFDRVTSHPKPVCQGNKKHIGFAVDQIGRATHGFKLVRMFSDLVYGERKYRFEIYAGDSWRLSKTVITCPASDLDYDRMKSPVYFDGSVHWLRQDGSIVAINLETEHARLIPIEFPHGLSLKALFAAGDGNLVLVSATKEVIYVYALEDILSDPKWVLVTQIRNVVPLDETRRDYRSVEAYDGKCLVLVSKKNDNRVIHVYDLSANKWKVMGSIPEVDANRDVFKFTPSMSNVVGLDQILASDDYRISTLSSIMGLINGKTSSETVEKQLRKRMAEAGTKKLVRQVRPKLFKAKRLIL